MKHARTSLSHPLYVSDLAVGPGRLGLTICPGKKGDSVFGAPWDRDLSADLAAIRTWGAKAVLTLVQPHEFLMLGVERLGGAVRDQGMEWHHFPIPDLGAPADLNRSGWWTVSTRLHKILDEGGRVLIHCRGGLGRAGTMAALLLIERGDTAEEAMKRIRAVRQRAIETATQERFLIDRARLPDQRAERIRASLFGGAIGDALGAEIEFWTLPQIRQRFPTGVDEMLPHDGRVGAITDDTQMTLFTAEGLIRAAVRSIGKGTCHPPSVIHHALMRWYVTQGGRPAREVDTAGLVADPRLHRRRAPGITCMSALGASQTFGDAARNDSKGCGTIMRVAPVALMGRDPRAIETLAMESSALTHGHKTGQESAAAWALILAEVLRGAPVEATAESLVGRSGAETTESIRSALMAPRDGRPETVESLGGGWVAEEALAIALYAALASSSFEEGLRIAVTHSGDSDSTAAIAGNLLGLMYPREVMAHPWRREIECADLIDRLARDMDTCLRDPDACDDAAPDGLEQRYPGLVMMDEPITLVDLITSRLVALSLSQAALFEALGFRSHVKGTALMERLAKEDLRGVEHLRRPLAATLEVAQSKVDAAIAESCERRRRREDAEWRAEFRPHAVLTTTNRIPQPIFAAALTGSERMLFIELPVDLPVQRWPQAVAAGLPPGVPGFGWVTGFVINYTPDRAVRFDCNATPVEELTQAYRRGSLRMRGVSAAVIGGST